MNSNNLSSSPGSSEILPTEAQAQGKRRRFSARYKLRILEEADACVNHGDLGALLRREGLYSSYLAQWRKQRDSGTLWASTKAGKELRAHQEEIRRLRKELSQSQSRLHKAEAVIEIQKKACALFGASIPTEADER